MNYSNNRYLTLGQVLVVTLLLSAVTPVLAQHAQPYQKPGAAIRLLSSAPVTLVPGDIARYTLILQPGEGSQVLDISLRQPQGFQLLGEQQHWLMEATGEPIQIPVEIQAGDKPGNFALNLQVRAWPGAEINRISELRQLPGGLSRVLGLGVIIAATQASNSAGQQKTASTAAVDNTEVNPVQTLSDGRKVHWLKSRP